MKELIEYINDYAVEGECQCGKCADGMENAEDHQPEGDIVDMVFFNVGAGVGVEKGQLEELVKANVKGVHCDVNMFDGKEHSYLEVGGWVGDQKTALMLMGLGAILGLWNLLTPKTMVAPGLDDDVVKGMAAMGMVAVKAAKE